jgi:hypothetical protein
MSEGRTWTGSDCGHSFHGVSPDLKANQGDTMPTIDREWITSELDKGLAAERTLAAEARARAESPPDPTLSLIYNELAAAEDRHHLILEIIATRYGHTPTRDAGGGSIGGTFGWLRGKVTELGSSPFDRLTYDLVARASSVLWYTAWVHTFEAVGDAESARELMAVLTEKRVHCEALQRGLNRLVEGRVKVADAAPAVDGAA